VVDLFVLGFDLLDLGLEGRKKGLTGLSRRVRERGEGGFMDEMDEPLSEMAQSQWG
jgi:hypothetical protein